MDIQSKGGKKKKNTFLNHDKCGISTDHVDDADVAEALNALKMATKTDLDEKTDGTLVLKRDIGLLSSVAIITGTMIGSGIFISPKGVLRGTGSVGACLCVWLGCGVISLLGSLCYAELGSMIRLAGGEYAYFLKAYGGLNRLLGPIQAFLYAWTSILVLRPSSLAVMALAFAEYTMDPFMDACRAPEYINKMLAIACILIITIVNCWSVKASTVVQNFFTGAKLLALVIISVGGIVRLVQGNVENFTEGFSGTIQSPSVIALAFYNGLWAYDGWNNLNFVTEEIKNPKRNLPLAIAISIPLVTLLYLLVNVSYFTVMSKDELLASTAVGVAWGNDVLGIMAWIIPVSVAFSTFGACNGSTLSSSRIVFASAREGHMVSMLSSVHVTRFTPMAALIFNAIISICMTIPGNISSLIDFFTFASWMFYGLTFLCLIVMRFTMKDLQRPYKVPIPIPIICLLISIYLVIAPIVESPAVEFLYAFMFTMGGLLFYVPFVFFGLNLPGLNYITEFVLMFLESAPSEYRE